MIPALLLALVTLLVVPLFPGDAPAYLPPEPPAPVQISVAVPLGEQAASPHVADAATRIVERVAEQIRARRLVVASTSPSVLLVSAGQGTSPSPVATKTAETAASSRTVKLSIGLNSSSVAAASGTETHFGGDGDLAWRLAYLLQRNITGGLRDVLGYEVYDRGVQEEAEPPSAGAVTGSLTTTDPWVTVYPLFATNAFESVILSSPGSIDVLSFAISNAVSDYLDPAVGTPKRTAQADWMRAPSWQPVEPKAIYRTEHPTKLALTFDGGASSVPTPAILKALKDSGIHATMFMTADFVDRNPDLVMQMARDGHEFGNHSATHPDMTTISNQAIIEELDRLETSVKALTGKSTRPWFRPPFGAVDDRVLAVAASQGYNAVMWTTDSADWRNDVAASTVASRILRYSEPGDIMIEHLGSPQSAEVLADVLKTLKERGLSFGTLSEVLGAP